MMWDNSGESFPPSPDRLLREVSSLKRERDDLRMQLHAAMTRGGEDRGTEVDHLRTEVDMLRKETSTLKKQLSKAEERSGDAMQQYNEYQQRLLKSEAENSSLHESLREAQLLLEEALSDSPNLDSVIQNLKHNVKTDTIEIQQLYAALKDAQGKSLSMEQQHREAIRQRDETMREMQILVSLASEGEINQVNEETMRNAQTYISTLKQALATTKIQLAEMRREVRSSTDGVGIASSRRARIPPARLHHLMTIQDPTELRSSVQELLQEIADLREFAADSEMNRRSSSEPHQSSLEGQESDRELLGHQWDKLLTPEEKLARYRARLRQCAGELSDVKEELKRAQRQQFTEPMGSPRDTDHIEQIMRELADTRADNSRLRNEKQRLLTAVKQASIVRRSHDDSHAASYPDDGSSIDESFYDDDDDSLGKRPRRVGTASTNPRGGDDFSALREERDKLVDQLVAARAAAQAAELLKIDSQDERREILSKLDDAQTRIVELQHRIQILSKGPITVDAACDPVQDRMNNLFGQDGYGIAHLEEDALDVTPAQQTDQDATFDKKQAIDEYALESLRHVLSQTQQLLERSDQQLLEERDKSAMATDQIEEVRGALEKTLREGAELQQERDALIVERDQWAQAARDADDARRKLVEHVEMLQSGGSQRRLDAVAKTPEVADLLREKAELLVQLDILKERLADSMEELEGARRELVSSLDARSELQREQDKNSDLMTSLREVEASRDKLEQENNRIEEEAKLLHNQLGNANLVKKCSSERLEQMKRETDEMKTANDQLKRELEAQMKEIAFLCDTLTETSAQYEDSAQKLEQSDAERNKLLAEKHKDLERIEELSGKLTEVRLQNDKDAVEERRQLQSEREFDAQMLADRMKELQECKDEINEVKARATKAINVLKASLQNALLQMKTLGDEFEVERSELQEKLYSLDKQHREATSELEHTKRELQSQLTKDGTDRLREKVVALSQGLTDTKERFAEQTQAYEKTKGELKSARKQLHDNADFKSLFEEANDTVERLTNRTREFTQENKDLRDKLQELGIAGETAVQEAQDEATLALREQIQNLTTELKREKDLRLRLREQNDRMKNEQEKYETDMNTLTKELTEQLQDKTVELQGIGDVHVKQRKALKQSNRQDHDALKDVGGKYKQLLLDYEQREQDIEDLAQELQNQRDLAQALQQNTEEETHQARASSDELFRTLLRIENFCSTYSHGETSQTPEMSEGVEKPHWTVKELPEAAMNAVKSAIQALEQKCANQGNLLREELGAASAEVETSKIDLIERLKKSEELHQLAVDELSLIKAENKTYRDENSKIRMENLKLIDLTEGSEGLHGINTKLQSELQEALNERDQLQTLLQQAKGSQSGEYASLLEANQMAQVALEKMQREVANAKKEAVASLQQHEASQAVVAQLTDTLKETQKTVLSSEQSVISAQKERDDANLARDRAVRDKLTAEKEVQIVRDELLQTKTDFARLQAVCQVCYLSFYCYCCY